jgi:hypothetical protein
VDEWKLRPAASDNHWLDGVVGCAVAASIQGATLQGLPTTRVRPRRKVTLAELAERARQWKAGAGWGGVPR